MIIGREKEIQQLRKAYNDEYSPPFFSVLNET